MQNNEYLDSIFKFGIDLSLDRIKILLELLNNPQDKLKFVHVAGTNGKGSTCAFIESIIRQAGYKTGKFVSPHLEEFNERISVNGTYVSDQDIDRLNRFLKDKIDIMLQKGYEHPTQFEVICAMAFQYFFEQSCDIVVLEVGLGGRLDATNVIKSPLVSVITPISFDHIDRLGNTLEAIAREKAGIIKPECAVVSAPQTEEVKKVIKDTCQNLDCPLNIIDYERIVHCSFESDYQIFDFEKYEGLKIKLLGEHQVINAVTALKAVENLVLQGYKIKEKDIYKGLENAKNKGRFEILGHKPEIVIDGSHNLSGFQALKHALLKYYSKKKIILVMAVLSNKDYKQMVEVIAPLIDVCIISEPVSDAALPAVELEKCFTEKGKKTILASDIHNAVDHALDIAKSDDMICFCGSLYFIGYVRSYYMKYLCKNSDYSLGERNE